MARGRIGHVGRETGIARNLGGHGVRIPAESRTLVRHLPMSSRGRAGDNGSKGNPRSTNSRSEECTSDVDSLPLTLILRRRHCSLLWRVSATLHRAITFLAISCVAPQVFRLSTYHSPGPSRVFGSLSWPSLIARRKPLRGFLFLLFPSVLAGAGVSLAIMTVEGHDSGGEWRTTDCRRGIDGSVLLCHQQAPDEMIGRW